MQRTFTFYTDPGHGWFKVAASDLFGLGLKVEDFSVYSYYNNGNYYLEEDCDATKFIVKYREDYGFDPAFRDSHRNSDSPIRNYGSIYNGANRLELERKCLLVG